MFCRVAARELSLLAPQLDKAGIRLIGIGLEELGVQDFIDGKFFEGELYIDTDKKSYKALKFKRLSVLSLMPALVAKVARDAIRKAKELGLKGDMKGDGFQNGGLLVVAGHGEKILYEFKQDNPADHADNAAILQALGLDAEPEKKEADVEAAEGEKTKQEMSVTDIECEDTCALPPKK